MDAPRLEENLGSKRGFRRGDVRQENREVLAQLTSDPTSEIPFPNDYGGAEGFHSLFQHGSRKFKKERYLGGHTGGDGAAGVDSIALSAKGKTINIGGNVVTAGEGGKIVLCDADYWANSLVEYQKKMELVEGIAQVILMSSAVALQIMGKKFLLACQAGQGADYAGDNMPPALVAAEASPDVVRCLPDKSPQFAISYAKLTYLIERTSVTFDGPIKDLIKRKRPRDETNLDEAVA